MFCTQCGSSAPEAALFCPACGNRLQVIATEIPQAAEPQREAETQQEAEASQVADEQQKPAGIPSDEETVVLPVETDVIPDSEEMPAPASPSSTWQTVPAEHRQEQPNDATAMPQPGDPAAPTPEAGEQKAGRLNKRTIIIIAVAAAIILGIIIGVVVKTNIDARIKEANEALHPVPVSIVAPGFTNEATHIPVRVTGTNAEKEPVDSLFFVDAEGSGITLSRGSYKATFPGGYLTADGTVCKAPDIEVSIELAGEGTGETTVNVASDAEVAYAVVPAANVSDELLAEIAELAAEDSSDGGKAASLTNVAKEKRAAVQKEQQRIEAEKAAAEKAAQEQREMKDALAANPSVVQAAPSRPSDFVTMTGTVDVQQAEDLGARRMEDVCMMHLPAPVTVTGTQYGEPSYDIIILPKDLAGYAGRTITINTRLNVRATASIASARFSPIICSETSVVREYATDGNANSVARFSQTALDAAKALFTTAEVADGKVTKTGSAVGQFIAEKSAASQYASGWNADAVSRATDASITGMNENKFMLDVVFENNCDNLESTRVHIAHVTLTFNESGKITDIAFEVV